MTFTADLQRFRTRTLEKYVKVKRLSAFDLFSAIVLETPVDKGVLRNNWFSGISNPSREEIETSDPSGSSAINRIQNILNGSDLLTDVFLTNNLPYAARIEFDGHSGKAPQGMVRVNTLRWQDIVRVNARRVNRGS